MPNTIPAVANTTITDYDVIVGSSCISYGEFVKKVNSHIKNGYQPYDKLVTVRNSLVNCTTLYQVVVKYNYPSADNS